MANENSAVNYVLHQEDAQFLGTITRDRGGRTRWGIAEKFHPQLSTTTFYTTMSPSDSLEIATDIYIHDYCKPLCIADMQNQDVANKVLSLGVNVGIGTVSRWLQDAVHVIGDGRIGPLTLDALDKADQLMVRADLCAAACAHYREIVADDPSQQIYLNGWLRRANA